MMEKIDGKKKIFGEKIQVNETRFARNFLKWDFLTIFKTLWLEKFFLLMCKSFICFRSPILKTWISEVK